VVIGIIALLISILLPSLNKARKQAQTLQCLANLRSIGQAIIQYTNNNHGSLPYGYWNGDTTTALPSAAIASVAKPQYIPTQSDWSTLLMQNIFGKGDGTWATESLIANGMFQCPAADLSDPKYTVIHKLHYGCHPRLMPNIGQTDPARPTIKLQPYKISRIQRSSEVMLVWDAQQTFPNAAYTYNYGNSFPVSDQVDDYGLTVQGARSGEVANYLLVGSAPGGVSVVLGDAIWTSPDPTNGYVAGTGDNGTFNGPGSSQYPNFSAEIQWRHGNNEHVAKANFLFVDGHAETLSLNFGVGNNSTIGIGCDVKDKNLYVNPNY